MRGIRRQRKSVWQWVVASIETWWRWMIDPPQFFAPPKRLSFAIVPPPATEPLPPLPEYHECETCCKCGASGPAMRHVDPAGQWAVVKAGESIAILGERREHLVKTCWRCGFVWQTAVKPPRAVGGPVPAGESA